mgnify:CR=1 FL=1|jgi:hypothetical protein
MKYNRVFIGLLIGLLIGVLINPVSLFGIDHIKILINGKQVYTDVPPQIISGRTMVPIRFIAENLNCNVEWDANNRIVKISNKEDIKQISPPKIEPKSPTTSPEPRIEPTPQPTPKQELPKYNDTPNIPTNQDSIEDKNQKARELILNKIEQIRSEGPVGYWPDNNSYNSELTQKQNERQQYQSRLDSLALDDSRETQYQKTELTQKIQQLDEIIKEMRDKHSRQIRIENLQQQLNNL